MTPGGEETPGAPEQPNDWAFYQYDLALEDQAYKEEFLAKFDLIRKRRLDTSKPYFVIYDPSTLKNRDVMALVRERVNDAQIGMQREFEECKTPLDAFTKAQECEID